MHFTLQESPHTLGVGEAHLQGERRRVLREGVLVRALRGGSLHRPHLLFFSYRSFGRSIFRSVRWRHRRRRGRPRGRRPGLRPRRLAERGRLGPELGGRPPEALPVLPLARLLPGRRPGLLVASAIESDCARLGASVFFSRAMLRTSEMDPPFSLQSRI